MIFYFVGLVNSDPKSLVFLSPSPTRSRNPKPDEARSSIFFTPFQLYSENRLILTGTGRIYQFPDPELCRQRSRTATRCSGSSWGERRTSVRRPRARWCGRRRRCRCRFQRRCVCRRCRWLTWSVSSWSWSPWLQESQITRRHIISKIELLGVFNLFGLQAVYFRVVSLKFGNLRLRGGTSPNFL